MNINNYQNDDASNFRNNNISGNSFLDQERIHFLKGLLESPLVDENGLNDIQLLSPPQQAIALAHVGIERFRLPVSYAHPFGPMNHDTHASLFVNLRPGKTGLNMSRMVEYIQAETSNKIVDPKLIRQMATGLRSLMCDSLHESPLEWSKIHLKFPYALKQTTLKSERWGWQYYDCELMGIHKLGKDQVFLVVNYEYSATCPCALSMSKQYEQEFNQHQRQDGYGVAVAHSQRAKASVTVQLTEQAIESGEYFIPELVNLLRLALPTETQSLAKRMDEQAFAILNGSNPMFVEHAGKYVHQILEQATWIQDWFAKLEHFESLHSHNAVAELYKGIPEGLKNSLI
ncbi:MAG: GTP cyclohydrolase I FolE2, partial [Bacteriovoracaceae bacterium]|nr:GTP cyclohydrolase I FolE2 [Bacteriovoracaceae bacterium]